MRADGFLKFEQSLELGLFALARIFAFCLGEKAVGAPSAGGCLGITLQRDLVFARQLLDSPFETPDAVSAIEDQCDGDERTGVQCLRRALSAPTRQIGAAWRKTHARQPAIAAAIQAIGEHALQPVRARA